MSEVIYPGEVIIVTPCEEFRIGAMTCPECGGQLLAEAYEWDAETKRPTVGGLHVYCENAPLDPTRETIRHDYIGWEPVHYRAARWVRQNVRVLDADMGETPCP